MRLISLLSLIIFIGCNMPQQPQLSLLATKDLTGFSSASAIEFYKDRFYIIGDDSRYLLIADKEYNTIDTVLLFPGESLRIPKKEKADLEAAVIHEYNGKEYLIAIGSGSTPERENFYIFPLDDPRAFTFTNRQPFYHSMREYELPIINIEGLAIVNNKAVFANRANLAQPDNHLFICDPKFLFETSTAIGTTCKLELSKDDGFLKGVSGLSYLPEKDLLLFTASVEETASAVEDGAIGNSYLGYITGFAEKMRTRSVKPDQLFNLTALHAEFKNEKIESVCVESAGDNIIMHLVADNDNGTSTIFKISMPTPAR